MDSTKTKWWAIEMHKNTVDQCLQVFGGYGHKLECPIARAFADTRISTTYGGTTKLMKTITAKDLLAC